MQAVSSGARALGSQVVKTAIRSSFPWLRHRTTLEVARTEALAARADAGREKMTPFEAGEFDNLLIKARRNNPPAEPAERGGAA